MAAQRRRDDSTVQFGTESTGVRLRAAPGAFLMRRGAAVSTDPPPARFTAFPARIPGGNRWLT
jgi:hypothetical protein